MNEYDPNVSLSVSNHFQAVDPVPGITGYGEWTLDTSNRKSEQQYAAILSSSRAPWHGLLEALDQAGARLPEDPVSIVDEADAIVACCWRYGSYFHVLTAGELFPDFQDNPGLSRVADSEMKRINLEFSSGLARWLKERSRDPATINRRVRAALQELPTPWRPDRTAWDDEHATNRAQAGIDQLPLDELSQMPVELTPMFGDPIIREEANFFILQSYRNGQIEDFHSGETNLGTVIPGYMRFTSPEVQVLASPIAENLSVLLASRLLGSWQVAKRIMVSLRGPTDWSVTDETAPIEYPGFSRTGPLDARMRQLAELCPTVYGSFWVPSPQA